MKKIKTIWRQIGKAPLRVKIVACLGLLYLANPIDLIPDFIPVLGQLDDLIVVAFVTKYIKKHLPNFEV